MSDLRERVVNQLEAMPLNEFEALSPREALFALSDAAIAIVLEEAAKVADRGGDFKSNAPSDYVCKTIAKTIRALQDKS